VSGLPLLALKFHSPGSGRAGSALLLSDRLDCFLVAACSDNRIHLIAAEIDNAAYSIVELAGGRSRWDFRLYHAMRALRGRGGGDTERGCQSNDNAIDPVHSCRASWEDFGKPETGFAQQMQSTKLT
jgi:hypothetical protein